MDIEKMNELLNINNDDVFVSPETMERIMRFMDYFIEIFGKTWDYDLNDVERRRLLGSGIRRYGFIDKTSDLAAVNHKFYPIGFDADEMKKEIRDIEFFRNFLQKLRAFERIITNALLVRSDEAYRQGLMFYNYVRSLARAGNPEAITIFDMLEPFFRRQRREGDEPTEHEVERDVRALLHGKKDGKILIEGKAKRTTASEVEMIDETFKPKGAFKATIHGRICSACGTENESHFKFCSSCGQKL